jgi:putative membrane protein
MIDRFSVTTADLLGKGGESEVYALDDARVLRIYKAQAPVDYIARRQAFYQRLEQLRPPFELPVILESGAGSGRSYTVERRMRGQAFAGMLPELTGAERRRALASYLHVAAQIGSVSLPGLPFGEILAGGEPLQCDSWARFVWGRLQQAYRQSRPDLEQDVPGVDDVLVFMRAELEQLEGFAEKRLVHGDYFPGNVYIDDDLAICGVGDFGYTTLVGDPRMDLAGAIAFLEVVDGYSPEDTPFLTALAEERHGASIARWLAFYRLYYSFYFSTCKLDDPRTYAWCVSNLRAGPPAP